MSKIDFEEMAKRWWVQAATPEINKRVQDKKITDALLNAADLMGVDKTGLLKYLKQLSPRKSKRDPENVAYFGNSYKYDRDVLTPIQPGRFFKTVFPSADDNLTEAFTLFWKNNIAFDSSDYVLSIGTTREDFKSSFVRIKNCHNIDYNYFKSISDSCMRYTFDRLVAHPAEVYASGDFEVVTVKNKKGVTRARCLVRIKNRDGSDCYIYNKIYACDNHSGHMIRNYILSKTGALECYDCDDEEFGSWHGARLLKIAQEPDEYICPYVDNARYVLLDGGNLVLVSYDYFRKNHKRETANGTGGIIYLEDYERNRFTDFVEVEKPVEVKTNPCADVPAT